MYGLLGSDNIWPRYNYLKIWNLTVQKNYNIEKIENRLKLSKLQLQINAKVVLSMHITNQKLSFDIFRTFTKYFHGTYLNILMIFEIS